MQVGDSVFSFFLYMLIHLEVMKSSFLGKINSFNTTFCNSIKTTLADQLTSSSETKLQ